MSEETTASILKKLKQPSIGLNAATLDGGQLASVTTKAAAYTVVAADSKTTFTSSDAAAATMFTLPLATVGLEFSFVRTVAQALNVDPLTHGFRGQTADKYLSLDTIGDAVTIRCVIAGTWEIVSSFGTLAYEA